jgi:hypothetical protein
MAVYVTDVAEDYADVAGREVKMLVCGPPGSGKTLFASTWPNPLYLDLEGRLLSIRHKKGIKRVRCNSMSDVELVKSMLDQDPDIRAKAFGGPVDTVVIDTVDEMARLAQRERLRSEKRETFTMQDWGVFGDTLRALCRSFRNLDGLNVLFLCHIKPSEDGETGKIMYRPDISGSVGNEIASYVDEALLVAQRTTVDPTSGDRVSLRVLQAVPDSSHDWVKDHSGVLPPEMVLNFVDDGERILKLVFGDTPPAPRPAVTVETGTSSTTIEATPEPALDDAVTPPKPSKKDKAQPQAENPPVETKTEVVPEKGTERDAPHCARCGAVIEDTNVAEISEIRFGERLCRTHFSEARAAEQNLTK